MLQKPYRVILGAAGLIYRVVSVLTLLDISLESIINIFKQQMNTMAQVSSLGAAAHLAVRCYNRMVTRRNDRLFSNRGVGIAKVFEKLSYEVFTLCFF